MSGDVHVRFCERPGVQFPWPTHLVVMAKSREAIEQAIPKIEAWLKERGLELNREKTRIVHRSEGFNFLGFHIRLYGKKLIIKPQKEKAHGLLKTVKTWLKEHRNATPEAVIHSLNPILRGWAFYYRYVSSKKLFQKMDKIIWHMLWRWAKRRHPNKSAKWILQRYFAKHENQQYTFYADTTSRQGRPTRIHLERISKVPILRHIKVKGTASPDDPDLIPYWEARRIRMGRHRVPYGSKLYQVAQGQHWKCPGCGEALFDGRAIDLHHISPLERGGTETVENLLWLHEACHYSQHEERITQGSSA